MFKPPVLRQHIVTDKRMRGSRSRVIEWRIGHERPGFPQGMSELLMGSLVELRESLSLDRRKSDDVQCIQRVRIACLCKIQLDDAEAIEVQYGKQRGFQCPQNTPQLTLGVDRFPEP